MNHQPPTNPRTPRCGQIPPRSHLSPMNERCDICGKLVADRDLSVVTTQGGSR